MSGFERLFLWRLVYNFHSIFYRLRKLFVIFRFNLFFRSSAPETKDDAEAAEASGSGSEEYDDSSEDERV